MRYCAVVMSFFLPLMTMITVSLPSSTLGMVTCRVATLLEVHTLLTCKRHYPALGVSRYLHHGLAPFANELPHHFGWYPHFALCKVITWKIQYDAVQRLSHYAYWWADTLSNCHTGWPVRLISSFCWCQNITVCTPHSKTQLTIWWQQKLVISLTYGSPQGRLGL